MRTARKFSPDREMFPRGCLPSFDKYWAKRKANQMPSALKFYNLLTGEGLIGDQANENIVHNYGMYVGDIAETQPMKHLREVHCSH